MPDSVPRHDRAQPGAARLSRRPGGRGGGGGMTGVLLPTRDEIQAGRIHGSLGLFVEEAWPVLEPRTCFVANWHIDAICEHLEAITNGELNRLIINIPPRHMKS